MRAEKQQQVASKQAIFKIQLSETESALVSQLLPKKYTCKLYQTFDEKRIRTPKRTDDMFETNLSKIMGHRDDSKHHRTNKQAKEAKQSQSEGEKVPAGEVKEKQVESEVSIREGGESKKKKGGEKAANQKNIQKNSENPVQKQQKYSEPKNQMKGTGKMDKKASQEQMLDEKMEHSLVSKHKDFCLSFLKKLRSHKAAWPFRQPVDPIGQGVPHYFEIVKDPMDLKTIQRKINNGKYQHISQFHGDINKIFLNSYKFNPRQTQYYTLTNQLQAHYQFLLKSCDQNPNFLEPQKNNKKQQQFNEQDNKKKKPITNIPKGQEKVSQTKPLTIIQKRQLGGKIKKLPSSALEQVVQIAYNSQNRQINQQQMQFTLDLERMTEETLQKLQRYIHKFEEEQKSRSMVSQTKISLF